MSKNRYAILSGSHDLQVFLNPFCERVRATEHLPRDRFYLLQRHYRLAEIVERGVGVSGPRIPRRRPRRPPGISDSRMAGPRRSP